MKTKALAREDRQRQILQCFAAELQSGNSGEMTIANIAHAMHLAVSTKLRIMVMELVVDGSLDFRDEPIPGVTKFRRIYSPNRENFKTPTPEYKMQGRAIKITANQRSFFAEMK